MVGGWSAVRHRASTRTGQANMVFRMTTSVVLCLVACCLFQPSFQQGKSNNCDKGQQRYDDCGDGTDDLVCSPIGGSSGSKLKCITCLCDQKDQCYVANTNDVEASCECPEGKTGQYCDQDVDYCANNNCQAPAYCVNGATGFTCACPQGYTPNVDGVSCDDVDECLQNPYPCFPNATVANCINNNGSFECSCNSGYQLNVDQVTCDDVDECAATPDPCTPDDVSTCHNTDGSFYCSCDEGYELDVDDVTCLDIDECAIPEVQAACSTPYACTENDPAPGYCCDYAPGP